MSLLTELIACYVTVFYKDFAPPELGSFFPLKAIKISLLWELFFRCAGGEMLTLNPERRFAIREARRSWLLAHSGRLLPASSAFDRTRPGAQN